MIDSKTTAINAQGNKNINCFSHSINNFIAFSPFHLRIAVKMVRSYIRTIAIAAFLLMPHLIIQQYTCKGLTKCRILSVKVICNIAHLIASVWFCYTFFAISSVAFFVGPSCKCLILLAFFSVFSSVFILFYHKFSKRYLFFFKGSYVFK